MTFAPIGVPNLRAYQTLAMAAILTGSTPCQSFAGNDADIRFSDWREAPLKPGRVELVSFDELSTWPEPSLPYPDIEAAQGPAPGLMDGVSMITLNWAAPDVVQHYDGWYYGDRLAPSVTAGKTSLYARLTTDYSRAALLSARYGGL